jgi:nitrogen-specific signal transduction histidine kinase
VETLRQVLTTLAHYINNSTTTIFGYAQLCEQDPTNAERCKKLAKIGIKETQKITFVIRELENFINSMEIKTTDYVNIPNAMFEIEENIKKKMEELE